MMIKFILSICVIFVSFTQAAISSQAGLTQEIITRYLKYSFQPAKRDVFKSRGHVEKFQERNTQILRDRVTPMLPRFKEIYEFSLKNNIPLNQFDPTIKSVILNSKTLNQLETLKYPVNIKWLSREEYSKGIEFIELTLKSKLSQEQFLNTISSIERILALNLLREKEKLNSKAKKLTPREQEMLEPIKFKEVSYYKYQDYYGIYYKFSGLVEAGYFSEIQEMLKNDFTTIQQNFKSQFYRSKEVNMGVNAKIILNLQQVIEDHDFENLDSAFLLPTNKLPKTLLRLTKYSQVSQLEFLVAKKEDSHSIEPIIRKIIEDLL